MIAYLLPFLFASFFGFAAIGRAEPNRRTQGKALVLAVIALLLLLVGFRQHIGCDWGQYSRYYDFVRINGFDPSSFTLEIGYSALNWVSARFGGGIYLVNVVCALLLLSGLYAFCNRQPRPMMTLALAIPILINVIAMGFTRQAVGIGFLLFALNAYVDGRRLRYVGIIALGSLFHASILGFLPLVALIGRSVSLLRLAIGAVVVGPVAVYLLGSRLQEYMSSYADITAAGAFYRLGLTAVAGVVFFFYRKRWYSQYPSEYGLYTIGSLLGIVLLPAAFISSAGADRAGLYLIPIQIGILSRVAFLMQPPAFGRVAQWVVVGMYASVMLIWLNFSEMAAACWVPYRTVLMGDVDGS